jgi:flagellar biosynthesis protein FlhF
MRLRRFTGPDTAAALRRVREALGADAVILGTRAAAEGGIEITAAVDTDPMTPAALPAAVGDEAEFAVIGRELRELGTRVRAIDRTLRSRPRADLGLGAAAHELAERLALSGLAFHLAETIAASVERATHAGVSWTAALEASLESHLLGSGAKKERRVTAFVGPTGGGKTTSIAKIAAARLAAGARPGLVMADTYRIAAAEQLGTYARLLRIPMRLARDANELGEALASFADRDVVYVDTAGMGGDPAGGRDLRRLLGGGGEAVEVAVVVSAAASEDALRCAWRQIGPLVPTSCVITKVDEGGGVGTACTWAAEVNLALRWLGTGQRVPEDLAPASGSTLANWLTAA